MENDRIRKYFESLSPGQRQYWKSQYEKELAAITAGTSVMENMKEPWELGLEMLNEVIQSKDKPENL